MRLAPIKHHRGFFITFEGIDGSGKSTQAAMLADFLEDRGFPVVLTKEPGDWSEGKELRRILLHGDIRHDLTELYLFMADRCEHVAQVILPALDRGDWVICDRYLDSTLAYQCFGRGIDLLRVESLFSWSDFPLPDKTILISLPLEIAKGRMQSRGSGDRMEKNEGLLAAVERGFVELSERYPRIAMVNGVGSPEDVFYNVLGELEELIS